MKHHSILDHEAERAKEKREFENYQYCRARWWARWNRQQEYYRMQNLWVITRDGENYIRYKNGDIALKVTKQLMREGDHEYGIYFDAKRATKYNIWSAYLS